MAAHKQRTLKIFLVPNMAKFKLPSPSLDFVGKKNPSLPKPNFISPQGILLPGHIQSPPMFGPRGSTLPAKHLENLNKLPDEIPRTFFCEICEEDFQFRSQLEQHNSQHVQCGIDGCNFIAVTEVVDKHIEQQHNTGVFDAIQEIQTPEQIAKWAEERKKLYPTRAKVELRNRAQEARKKRGEKLEESKNRFGNNRDRRHARNQPTNKFKNDSRPHKNNRQVKPRKQEDGYARFLNKKLADVEVEKTVVQSKNETHKSAEAMQLKSNIPTPSAALSSLMGMYGSDDSDMDSEPDTKKIKVEKSKNIDKQKICAELIISHDKPKLENTTVSYNKSTSLNIDQLNITKEQNKIDPSEPENIELDSDDNAPEETKFEKVKEVLCDNHQKNETQTSKASTRKRVRTRRKENKTNSQNIKTKSLINYSKLRQPNQNTLLEKLLQPEIRHERNVILQCVRFVVENDFFGIGKK